MNGCEIRSRLLERLEVVIGIQCHQVAIEREIRDLPQRSDHRHPERHVGDEVAVHNIDMQQVDILFDPLDFVGEVSEVCGQDGWGDSGWLDHVSRLYPLLDPAKRNGSRLISGRSQQ